MTQALRFGFEGLEVYGAAREVLAVVVAGKAALRGVPGEVGSQLERAVVSVVANIAEATGRESAADGRRTTVRLRSDGRGQ